MQLTHCIVFMTNIETPTIYRHFLRLQSETNSMLDAFLCVNECPPYYWATERQPAHFRLALDDARQLLPKRYSECMQRGGMLIPGFSDLAYMPALLSAELDRYDYVWFLEYDVDYSGDWKYFFRQFMNNEADLLGTTLFGREQSEDWHWAHWSWFEPPRSVGFQHHFRSFLPIVRFSRRMLNCYKNSMANGDWRGHTEAIFPTLASANGLIIEDIGGCGPLTPPVRHGLNYTNNLADPALCPGTMCCTPRHISYYHDTPELFPKAGYLYHPVKTQLLLQAQAFQQLSRQIAVIHSSRSWQLTKPLRMIKRLVLRGTG